jgi:hypothetical protein
VGGGVSVVAATRYERITAVGADGKRMTRRCEIISESDAFVLAHILDAEWDRGGTFDAEGNEIDRHWLIDKGAITKRVPMRQNPIYGTWEPIQ